MAYLLTWCTAEIRTTREEACCGFGTQRFVAVNSTDRTRVLLRLDGAISNDDVSADVALLAVERGCSDAALTYGNVISIWTVRIEKIRILLAYAKIAHDN
jgi:hypothetical protein